MIRLTPFLLLGLLLLSALTPAGAAAKSKPRAPIFGIADQKTQFFGDELFKDLDITHARYVVPWDTMDGGFQEDELRAWLKEAKADGVKPLLSFGHSRREGRQKKRPSPRALQRQFRRLRVNFPWVTEYATWNEPNHCSQPLCKKPEIAARYHDALVRACPTCTILGGELLDSPNMRSWVKRFRRKVKHDPKVWGLHNYIDVNRFRTTGTRELMKVTRGQIWLTETGGIVNRTAKAKIPFEESERHAGKSTRWLFDRLTPLSSRIRRVYIYHWNPSTPDDTWDSALVDLEGEPRTAYRVLKNRIEKAQKAAKARSAARKKARERKAKRERS
ncbi:MAG: hypothetical protein H0W36_07930 [Gemmatimonadetes bacterium]|nr:hypothetical protein [Gemmatimonadota bacterium]